MPGTDRLDVSNRLWTAFAWAGVGAFFFLAVWYVCRIGDPMPSADNWANLDVFVRKAFYHGVGLSDFLWNRGVGDHSQPLNKALLWINARYFGLDFKLEALFGMALGLAALLVLWACVRDSSGDDKRWGCLGIVAIAAVFFSLNSSRTYSYSMVTMWFALYLGMFATVVATWRGLQGRSLAWLVAIAFVFGVAADDVGYLAAASIALALCLHGLRTGAWRRTLLVVGACVAAFAASRVFYACFQGSVGGAVQWHTSPRGFIQFLRSSYRDAWDWWAFSTASGFAHPGTMRRLVGGAAPSVSNALAAIVLPLHAWFWWKAWTRKRDLAGFMAVCIMLFYYAHVAGILYGRVQVFGTDYMNSPRYVSFYQLGVIALLLMFTASAGDEPAKGRRYIRWAYAVPLVAVILLQVPIERIAFAGSDRIMRYEEKKAYMLATMAFATPQAQQECMTFKEFRSICASEERRERLGGLLVNNQLSVFSPQFQRRYPRLAVAAAQARGDGP